MSGKKNKITDVKLLIPVIAVVFVLTAGFFILTGSTLLLLSKEKMTSKSGNYAGYINDWAGRILNELTIYEKTAKIEGITSEHARKILATSYGTHSEYPYGIYLCDKDNHFFDSSGWIPEESYVSAERRWYIEGLTHPHFAFGEPYIDARTSRPCVSATVKITTEETEGVLAADIYFDYIEELVERLTAQEIKSAFFVSAANRILIADSDTALTGKTLDQSIDDELHQKIAGLLDEGTTGLTRVHSREDYYVNIIKIPEMDWYFVTCMKRASMVGSLRRVAVFIFIIGFIGFLILLLLTNHASKNLNEADKEAKTDPLTGLYNRHGFASTVTSVSKKTQGGVMLLMDVDNFKAVNDRFGHMTGDAFLKDFSRMLDGYFNRSKDICARLGGDEFAVFAGRSFTPEELSSMLAAFIKLFHKTFDEKYDTAMELSVSIGAVFTRGGSEFNMDNSYHDADKALYEAKGNGKNGYVIACHHPLSRLKTP